MTQQAWLETKLHDWLAAYEQGQDLAVGDLCGADELPEPALRDQLQTAIVRLKQTEDLLDVTQPSGSGCSDVQATPAPERIGRYRIQSLLGEGGFGRLYRAQDDELQRPVAIKVPRFDRWRSSDDTNAYLREAQALATLHHPHILDVYDIGRCAEFEIYIVSRFIDGGTLADRLRERRPTHAETVSLIKSMAEALHHAHIAGFVHRDVKPANILLDRKDHAYLADFGLVLKGAQSEERPAILGTMMYMSPEQANGDSHLVDGRSDIYSLGAVMYEILCGSPPFTSSRAEILLDLIRRQHPKPPRQIDDQIPADLERICLKALAKSPGDRYTVAKDMAADLSAYTEVVSRQGSLALSGSNQAGNPRPFSRKHAVLTALGIVLAVIAIYLGPTYLAKWALKQKRAAVVRELEYRDGVAKRVMDGIDATLSWNGGSLDDGPWLCRKLLRDLLEQFSEFLTSDDRKELEEALAELDKGYAASHGSSVLERGWARKVPEKFIAGRAKYAAKLRRGKQSWKDVSQAVTAFCNVVDQFLDGEVELDAVRDAHGTVAEKFSERMRNPSEPPDLMLHVTETYAAAQQYSDRRN